MPFTIDPKKVSEAEKRFLSPASGMDERDMGDSRTESQGNAQTGKPDMRGGGSEFSGGRSTGYESEDDTKHGIDSDIETDYGGFGSGRELPTEETSTSPAPTPGPWTGTSTRKPRGTKETGLVPRGGETDLSSDPEPEPKPRTEETDILPPVPAVRRSGITGTVRGLAELKPEGIPGGLTRWFTSMFTGVPFTRERMGFRFMLKPDEWSDRGSRQVIMYGNIQEGFLFDGSKVIVHGNISGSGVIKARRIEIITDEESIPTQVVLMHQMSAIAVWLCTLVLLALAYGVVQVGIMVYNEIMRNLAAVVIILIIVIWLWRRLRRGRRRRRRWFF